METSIDFKTINEKIRQMRSLLDQLQETSGLFPALDRNLTRLSASLKMLELNVSDIVEPDSQTV